VDAPVGDTDTVLSFDPVSVGIIDWRWTVRSSKTGEVVFESDAMSPTFSCEEGGRGAYDVELSVTDGLGVASFRERRLVTCTLPRVADGRPVVTLDLSKETYLQGGKIGGVVVAPGTLVKVKGQIGTNLTMLNFQGTADAPIHFINDGLVTNTIPSGSSATKLWHMVNAQHVIIDGLGSDDYDHGIVLSSLASGGETGLFFRSLSGQGATNPLSGLTGIEAFGVEVGPNPGSGIEVNTKGFEQFNRDNWAVEGAEIHHTWVHDIGKEGFYIGYTRDWIGSAETHYAYPIRDAHLYRNTIADTGWDGLQVSQCAEGLEVHDNHVSGSGLLDVSGQSSSFQWNSGNSGHVYNNVFLGGSGSNFQSGCTGGDGWFYGNLWRQAPVTTGHLFYVQAGLAAGTELRWFANSVDTAGANLLAVNMTSPGCNEAGSTVLDHVQIENNAVVWPAKVGSKDPLILQMITGGSIPSGWDLGSNETSSDPAADGWCLDDLAAADLGPTCDTSPLLVEDAADLSLSGVDLGALPGGGFTDLDGRVVADPRRYGAWQGLGE
jgi:hypothetical protein